MRGDQLERYLRKQSARRVSITLDDDRLGIVRSAESRPDGIRLQLHGAFLDAPRGVLRALIRFLRRPEPNLRRRVVRLYREAGLARVGGGDGARRVVLRHRGRYFDLKQIFDDLNERWFDARIQAFITWGRLGDPRRRLRSIHFGSYNWSRKIIRIHPDLDRPWVPKYFVESVLFHEMLHVDLGVRMGRNGRRESHNREFRRRERAWPGYVRAVAWERAHLHYFLKR